MRFRTNLKPPIQKRRTHYYKKLRVDREVLSKACLSENRQVAFIDFYCKNIERQFNLNRLTLFQGKGMMFTHWLVEEEPMEFQKTL